MDSGHGAVSDDAIRSNISLGWRKLTSGASSTYRPTSSSESGGRHRSRPTRSSPKTSRRLDEIEMAHKTSTKFLITDAGGRTGATSNHAVRVGGYPRIRSA